MNTQAASAGLMLAVLALCGHAGTPILSTATRQGIDQVLISWDSVPGKVYGLKTTTNLSSPWQVLVTQPAALSASSNNLSYTVPIESGMRFFRVVDLDLVLIPAGSFTMGDTIGDNMYMDELPVHTVSVSAFYMDQYLVTKALWDEVYTWAIAHGYSFDYAGSGKAANHPVQEIDWYDAVKWCNARSEREGRTGAYYTDAALSVVYKTGQVAPYVRWNAGYRLPTEAEWEKAARGGLSGHRFPWGDTISHSQANYYSYWENGQPMCPYDVSPTQGSHPAFAVGGEPYTSPVGYFAPNGYGLYDMAGNAWEWCWDWYGGYSSGSQTDPRGPGGGSHQVFRGGSFYCPAWYCRVSYRFSSNVPTFRYSDIGFRSVLPPG